jgi:hypothetical protein
MLGCSCIQYAPRMRRMPTHLQLTAVSFAVLVLLGSHHNEHTEVESAARAITTPTLAEIRPSFEIKQVGTIAANGSGSIEVGPSDDQHDHTHDHDHTEGSVFHRLVGESLGLSTGSVGVVTSVAL